jgi:hypothetical protein
MDEMPRKGGKEDAWEAAWELLMFQLWMMLSLF